MSGHGLNLADTVVNDEQRVYIAERARGGAAMVGLNSAPVHADAHHFGEQSLALYSDEVVPGLTRLAQDVHEAQSLLFAILWHGGHNVPFRAGQAPVAPSPMPGVWTGDVPRSLQADEIRKLARSYGHATRRCREAGLDAVEVQTGSDYLLGSFLSPTLNRRNDRYGGSLENRVRAVREVLEHVREAAGDDMAVGVRTSAAHLIPTDPDGYGLEHSVPSMRLLTELGLCDWVSVIVGSHYAPDQLVPPMDLPRGNAVEWARAFRRELTVPVIVAGRIRTPSEAEDILSDGAADIVAMARSWIAEPDWIVKVERGEENRIRPCVSCNQGCWETVMRGGVGTCIANPSAARELELPTPSPTRSARQITVVGGGPASLEAARILALRGHDVLLCEQRDRLGGELLLAGLAPHRAELLALVSWWEGELKELGVEILLNTRLDPSDARDANELVWAVGAEPGGTGVWRRRPQLVAGIPGTEGLAHGRDLMRDGLTVAGRVLVIDEEGGWPAVSLAEHLAARATVTHVVVACADVAFGGPQLEFTLEASRVARRLAEAGVEVAPSTLVAAVDNGRATSVAGTEIGTFDAIVLSTGTIAPELPDGELAVGDCVAPRGIWAATNDAARLARAL